MIDTATLHHLDETFEAALETEAPLTLPLADVRLISLMLKERLQQTEAEEAVEDVPGVRLGDLLKDAPTGLFEDVEDSVEFARELRRKASRRRSLRDYYGE